MVLIQVAIGGAIGAVLRYSIGLWIAFPYGTIAVNVLGSFLMGLAFVLLGTRAGAPFVMAGILGGFTTFSAFSLDVIRLYEAGRFVSAGGYVIGSVLLSIFALIFGVALARVFT